MKFLIVALSFFFISCSGPEIKLDSLCVVNSPDNLCYINKEAHKQFTKAQMDHFYCVDQVDANKIFEKLKNCKTGIPTTTDMSLDSLCIYDISHDMCWVNQAFNKGFTWVMINGDLCLNELDLNKIVNKLKTCK